MKPGNAGGAKGSRKKEAVTEVQGHIPAQVCESTKQAGEEQPTKWAWTEPAVWKPRMLEALERGVRGGKWFSLIDKVYSENNLRAAFKRVRANHGAPGVDNETVTRYETALASNLTKLQEQLQSEKYEPSAVRRVYIPKAGTKNEKRPLGIPTVRDRVVQAAVMNVIEPIFEHEFKDCSYGFRPGRGCKDALREVTKLLKESHGHRHVVDADIQGFFDNINHQTLMSLVEKKVADGRVLKLINQFLTQGILENGEMQIAEAGTPQGGVISPLLANIYLHEVDTALTEQHYRVVRYADDLIILCKTAQEAKLALSALELQMQRLTLKLHPDKTKIVDMNQPSARFTFLGYEFARIANWEDRNIRLYPSKKSETKLRWQLRLKTSRLNGNAMSTVVKRVNVSLRGWFEYFKHCSRGAFKAQDSWVRARLRAILEKRTHHRSRGHGTAHFRWTNEYFHQLGLFCMEQQRLLLLQSACR